MCNFPERLLYNTRGGSTFRLAEDMKAWYILDAVMIGKRIVYCSRDRVPFREGENVRTVQIPGTRDFFSITTDGSRIYLIDGDETSKTVAIVRTNNRFEVEARVGFPGEPRDIVWHDGFLWLFKRTDRCVYKLAFKTLGTARPNPIGSGT